MSRTDFVLPDARSIDRLSGRLRLSDGVRREGEVVLYDTFDGLLWADGSTLFYDAGRLRLAELELQVGDEPDRVFAHELPPGALRDRLAETIKVRAALPQVRVGGTARQLRVRDELDKTVAWIEVRDPAVLTPHGGRIPLQPRAHVWPVRGYEAETEAVVDAMRAHFEAYERPLYMDAMQAVGRDPSGISAKVHVPLAGEQRADEATVLVLRALLDVIEANLEGTIADLDSEFLHDLRVSVRRSRSVQRECKAVFPAVELARFRTEFRSLQQISGESRDLDVYVLEFDDYRAMVPAAMHGDLEPLLRVLRSHRLTARREMVRALRSDRTAKLLAEWSAFLDRLVSLPLDDRPAAVRPIGALAGERIVKVYRRIVKMGRGIESTSPPEAYHELRKKGKELRYLLELFGAPLYPNQVVKPMIKALKALQDVLGRHQDREVQVATLRSLANEVSALPGGPPALMAMGVLIERLGQDEHAARDEFAERFAEFSSKSQRQLVKDTFGR